MSIMYIFILFSNSVIAVIETLDKMLNIGYTLLIH